MSVILIVMGTTKELYFLGILLPKLLAEDVISIKNNFAENYSSSKALNSPPHITIIPPFYADTILEKTVESNIENLTKVIQPFEIKLNGFGTFRKKVIYIDVEKNEDLKQFEKTFSDFSQKFELNVRGTTASFHPHVTLAFRDLTLENFNRVWPHYKNKPFAVTFKVASLHLLKHQNKAWNSVKEFNFSED